MSALHLEMQQRSIGLVHIKVYFVHSSDNFPSQTLADKITYLRLLAALVHWSHHKKSYIASWAAVSLVVLAPTQR